MLLAIDIGNSYTKFGIFESSSLIDKFSIPTERDYAVEEFRLDRLKGGTLNFDSILVASVVPELNQILTEAMLSHLNVEPRFIDHSSDFGLTIDYLPPEAAGIDRLVNASAAAAGYGTPVIACSFGTATTFDVVNKESAYIGGAIAPGMRLLAEALNLKTSKLPLVNVEKPETAIGRTTEGSIQSGIFNGSIGLVEGMLVRIIEELGEKVTVVGTGGFAKTIARESSMIDIVDENLTLDGIRLIAERMRR